jgi:hypothetical protein
MQNLLFYNFLKGLIEVKRMPQSSIAKTILRSKDFLILETAKFIELKTALNKGKYYEVINEEHLQQHFKNSFPNDVNDRFTAIQNAKSLRDSKGRKKESQKIVLLRGSTQIISNNKEVSLSEYTLQFNVFAMQLKQLKADKLCYVENLDCFMVAEKTINFEYTFIHPYGRIGIENFKNIETAEILFCPDYDFIGLNEYLKMKSIHPHTKLFIPDNYDDLFKNYCKPLKKKNGKEQQATNRVLQSNDELVSKICAQLLETKHFLEQQIVFQD